jgi:hypothetical protein
MAVPGSGELSLLKIWSEKNEDDYTANNADGESSFSLRGLSNNSHSDSTNGNIDLNAQSPNKPDQATAHAMSEFYSYDHDFQAIPCSKAMDVVFLLDYTGSMSNDMATLKSNVASISSKVVTESGGDYRLSAVLIDQDTSTPSYWTGNNTTVSNLPSANKYNSGTVWLSAVIPFANANKTDFDTKIGYLAAGAGNNSSTGMELGNGIDGPEPNDTAIDRVLNHDLAGSFRTGVTRMIILITDNSPDGDGDDSFNGAEETAKMGTLSNQAVAAVTTISVLGTFGNTSSSDGTTSRYDIYNAYANNTGGLTNFSGDPSDIEQFIEDICDDIATDFATVETEDVTSITTTGFTMNGDVTDQGGSTVTARGFVRSTSNINLFIGASGVTTNTVGSGTGTFSSAVTGLSSNTYYFYKAYATNTSGTSYGEGERVQTGVAATLYAKNTTTQSYPKAVMACTGTFNSVRYFDDAIPESGTMVYANSGGTITLGAGNYAYENTVSGDVRFTTNSLGMITSVTSCLQ